MGLLWTVKLYLSVNYDDGSLMDQIASAIYEYIDYSSLFNNEN